MPALLGSGSKCSNTRAVTAGSTEASRTALELSEMAETTSAWSAGCRRPNRSRAPLRRLPGGRGYAGPRGEPAECWRRVHRRRDCGIRGEGRSFHAEKRRELVPKPNSVRHAMYFRRPISTSCPATKPRSLRRLTSIGPRPDFGACACSTSALEPVKATEGQTRCMASIISPRVTLRPLAIL